jgi:hypothetical protein
VGLRTVTLFHCLSRIRGKHPKQENAMRVLGSLLVAVTTFTTVQLARAEDAPKPAPQVEALRGLIGSWGGKGTMMSEGKTHQINMTYDCVESAGAAGVKCKAVMTGIPGFTYTFDDLWGYSAQDKLTHWYTVTNAGEVHDHRGHFDMTAGLLQADIAVDGKLFTETIMFKRKGKSLAMSWNTTLGGTLREKGEMTLNPKAK